MISWLFDIVVWQEKFNLFLEAINLCIWILLAVLLNFQYWCHEFQEFFFFILFKSIKHHIHQIYKMPPAMMFAKMFFRLVQEMVILAEQGNGWFRPLIFSSLSFFFVFKLFVLFLFYQHTFFCAILFEPLSSHWTILFDIHGKQ